MSASTLRSSVSKASMEPSRALRRPPRPPCSVPGAQAGGLRVITTAPTVLACRAKSSARWSTTTASRILTTTVTCWWWALRTGGHRRAGVVRHGARVTLVHRAELPSVAASSIGSAVYCENRIKQHQIAAHFNTTIAIVPQRAAQDPRGELRIKNDFVLAMTGYHPDFSFLRALIEIPTPPASRWSISAKPLQCAGEHSLWSGLWPATPVRFLSEWPLPRPRSRASRCSNLPALLSGSRWSLDILRSPAGAPLRTPSSVVELLLIKIDE